MVTYLPYNSVYEKYEDKQISSDGQDKGQLLVPR